MPQDADTGTFPLVCHRCGKVLTAGTASLYVVGIEAFADPTPPPDTDDRSLAEISADINQLIEQMRDLSEQELMDQVYRRLTLLLCTPCYRHWIDHPTG